MSIYVHLVRHAQGYHNAEHNVDLPDPKLTPLGESQASALQAEFPHHDAITHLIASPLRRTIQTCLGGFAPAAEKGMVITLLPSLQEAGPWPSDTGSEPEVVMEEFGRKVDVSRVEKGWNDKTGVYRATFEGIIERGHWARRELQAIAREWRGRNPEGDAHLVVVGHGAMLHFIADCFHGIPPRTATAWENAAYRSFKFIDDSLKDREAKLLETDVSWSRLFNETPRLTPAENSTARDSYERILTTYLDGSWKLKLAESKATEEKLKERI